MLMFAGLFFIDSIFLFIHNSLVFIFSFMKDAAILFNVLILLLARIVGAVK